MDAEGKKMFKPVIYNDVDDDLYILIAYSKAMTRPLRWLPRPRNDIILWDSISFTAKLMKDFHIDSSIDTNIRQSILSIIKDNWDFVCEQDDSRLMLDFEFCLDTGESPPVCCRQPVYGIHERKIMTAHIRVLEDNDWICDCVGP